MIIQEGLTPGSVNTPVAQRSTLGWILICASSVPNVSGIRTSHSATLDQEDAKLTESLNQFWELESVPIPNAFIAMSKGDAEYEEHFRNTYVRDFNGRFMVRLPFISNNHEFPNSLNNAKLSFLRLEKRLCNNPMLYDKYNEIMSEYDNLNHMKFLGEIPKGIESIS